jgi:hypothetical protein
MRILVEILLLLVICPVTLSQTNRLQLVKELDFGGRVKDQIVTHKFLERENQILLVGRRSVRIMDAVTGEVVENRLLDIEEFGEDNPRIISPDNRRMLVFGNHSFDDRNNTIKRPPSIWDLHTGKQIAVLNKSAKPVRMARWSKNGRVLVTSSDRRPQDSRSVEISFLDGETFERKSVLPDDKINWWYFSEDGSKCVYTSAPITSVFLLGQFLSPRGGSINVFDTEKGTIETVIPPATDGSLTVTLGIKPSTNNAFLVYVAEKPKGRDAERRLVIRELENSTGRIVDLKLKAELPPAPKLPEYYAAFSDDGNYFAFDAGKTLQIIDLRSGKKKHELAKDDGPTHWLDDNKILLYNYESKLVARDIATGNVMYEQKLIYNYFVTGAWDSENPGYAITDQTIVKPHPRGKSFLTVSNQYIRLYDVLTGKLLQTLVEPPIDTSRPPDPKKGPYLSRKPLVSQAEWSSDGEAVYAISADKGTLTLWRMVK